MLSRLKIPSRFTHTGAGIRADLSIQQERPHCVSHAHRRGNERGDYLLGNLTCLSPSCSFLPLRLKDLEENCQNLRDRTSARVSVDGKLEEGPRRAGSSIVQREREERTLYIKKKKKKKKKKEK